MAVLECSDCFLLELDYLILFGYGGGRGNSSFLSLLGFWLRSLCLESIVLGCDLGKFFILFTELLLKSDSLSLEVEAVILLHVILLFKDEKILTFFI